MKNMHNDLAFGLSIASIIVAFGIVISLVLYQVRLSESEFIKHGYSQKPTNAGWAWVKDSKQ